MIISHTIEVKFRLRKTEDYDELYDAIEEALIGLGFVHHIVTSDYLLYSTSVSIENVMKTLDEKIEDDLWDDNDYIVITSYIRTKYKWTKGIRTKYVTYFRAFDGEWEKISPKALYEYLKDDE